MASHITYVEAERSGMIASLDLGVCVCALALSRVQTTDYTLALEHAQMYYTHALMVMIISKSRAHQRMLSRRKNTPSQADHSIHRPCLEHVTFASD